VGDGSSWPAVHNRSLSRCSRGPLCRRRTTNRGPIIPGSITYKGGKGIPLPKPRGSRHPYLFRDTPLRLIESEKPAKTNG